jgi:hypothetical protein
MTDSTKWYEFERESALSPRVHAENKTYFEAVGIVCLEGSTVGTCVFASWVSLNDSKIRVLDLNVSAQFEAGTQNV